MKKRTKKTKKYPPIYGKKNFKSNISHYQILIKITNFYVLNKKIYKKIVFLKLLLKNFVLMI